MNTETLDLPLSNLVKKPNNSEEKTPAIFFLHGYGSNMNDLFQLSQFFPDKCHFISLQAPNPVMFNGWSWFDLNPLNIFKLLHPKQINSSQKKIDSSINICLDKLNIDPENICLFGFSQGACIAFYTGLKKPFKYKAVVAICGWFSDKYFFDQFDLERISEVNIFVGNGNQDQRINIKMAKTSVENLSSLGIEPIFKEYDCGHNISNNCILDILKWLKNIGFID